MTPCQRTVALLADLLQSAQAGELRGVFVVQRLADGRHECCHAVADLDAMLGHVKTETIRLRLRRSNKGA